MTLITVPSAIISPTTSDPLPAGAIAVLWEIGHAVDAMRLPASHDDAVWLEIPTSRLRGPDGRDDNVNLRQWLRRLSKAELSGEYRGQPWGAVMLAEWHILRHGSIARLLIPPSAIRALKSGETFAKIEAAAAHHLPGHGRRLYAILADKKRLKVPHWEFEVDDLRTLMGVESKAGYQRWNNFRARVLVPAVQAINGYGTVNVTMTPVVRGRSVHSVRFDWAWKSMDQARVTFEENDRHSLARGREIGTAGAPPMIEDIEPAADANYSVVASEVAGLTQLLGNAMRSKAGDEPIWGGDQN